jgi:hypothetical protein
MRSLAVAVVNGFAEYRLSANCPRLPFAISLSSRSSPALRSARCRISQTLRYVSKVERLALLISRAAERRARASGNENPERIIEFHDSCAAANDPRLHWIMRVLESAVRECSEHQLRSFERIQNKNCCASWQCGDSHRGRSNRPWRMSKFKIKKHIINKIRMHFAPRKAPSDRLSLPKRRTSVRSKRYKKSICSKKLARILEDSLWAVNMLQNMRRKEAIISANMILIAC